MNQDLNDSLFVNNEIVFKELKNIGLKTLDNGKYFKEAKFLYITNNTIYSRVLPSNEDNPILIRNLKKMNSLELRNKIFLKVEENNKLKKNIISVLRDKVLKLENKLEENNEKLEDIIIENREMIVELKELFKKFDKEK